jgi:hypothetical protein
VFGTINEFKDGYQRRINLGGNENVKIFAYLKATIPNTDSDRSKTVGECGIYQLFG